VKKHFIKIHQTHYHNFILIQSCWITSQSRFQVTKKLIKNSSLSTWTNLENTYTVCKKKFVKFWTNISHSKTTTQKFSFGIKSKRIPRLSTVLPKLVSTASNGTQVLNHEPFQLDQRPVFSMLPKNAHFIYNQVQTLMLSSMNLSIDNMLMLSI